MNRPTKRRSLTIAASVVVLAIAGGGYAAYAAQSEGSGHYRTATVMTGSVSETLPLSGTITPTRRNDIAFATSGTVSKVVAAVGDKVAKGEVLARLDTTTLDQAVARAEADVASAKAQLVTDEASESSASVSNTPTDTSASNSSIQALAAAVAAARRLCASDTGSDTGSDGGSGGGQKPTANGGRPATCDDALAAIQQGVEALASSTNQSSQASQSGSIGGQGGTSGGTGGTGSAGGTVTAATIARDEASIAEAHASLVDAKVALKAAVIRAPVAGTVAEVDVSAGGQASAGTVVVTVIAPGTTTITLSATSAQVKKLAVGQTATVMPAGVRDSYEATVTRVGNVPTSSDTSDATYPVIVTLKKRGLTLLTGATAAVDIVIGEKSDVLTVPTSAVSNGTVGVVSGGTVTRTRVTTGLVGPTLTEITDGLDAGETVSLADLDAALPTGDNSTTGFTRPTFGGPTGFSQVRRAG